VTYEFFDGTQTTACATLVAASGGLWTADHILNGCAYVFFTFTYNDGAFPAGLPSIKFVVKGKPVYDPRWGFSYYSNNPALCIRDYMLMDETIGGMGCSSSEIDVTTFTAAANRCDELVATEWGTEARYTLNGAIIIEGTPASIVKRMLPTMDGQALYSQSSWKIYAGGFDSPVATLDETYLNGGISFNVGAKKSQLINHVKGTFIDPADKWAAKDFPAIGPVAAYIADDGGETLTHDMSLEFTTGAQTARRLAKIAMEKSRRGMVIEYPCNMKAFPIQPMDMVYVNNTLLGWSNLTCRVLDWSFSPMGGINLSLGREDADIYSWETGDVEPLPVISSTIFPSPWDVAPPADLAVVEELYAGNVGSIIKAKVVFSWTAGDVQSVFYDVFLDGVYQLTSRETSVTLFDLEPGAYVFGVRGANTPGSYGATVTKNYTVLGKTANPSTVTGLNIELTRGQVFISWNHITDADRFAYELQLGSTWDAGGNLVIVTNYAGTSYGWTPTTSGNITILIKAIDTTGNYSTNAASLTYTIVEPVPVTDLAQSVIDNIVKLSWTAATPGSFPVDYYEIWKGNTFAGATLIGRKYSTFDIIAETLGGTYKYWIRTVDIAGLISDEVGIYVTVNSPPDYVLISDQVIDLSAATLSSAISESTYALMPVNTTITFEDHFQTNPDTLLEPWSTPQDQIDDGFTYYN